MSGSHAGSWDHGQDHLQSEVCCGLRGGEDV